MSVRILSKNKMRAVFKLLMPGMLPEKHVLDRALPKKGRKIKETVITVDSQAPTPLHIQRRSRDFFFF